MRSIGVSSALAPAHFWCDSFTKQHAAAAISVRGRAGAGREGGEATASHCTEAARPPAPGETQLHAPERELGGSTARKALTARGTAWPPGKAISALPALCPAGQEAMSSGRWGLEPRRGGLLPCPGLTLPASLCNQSMGAAFAGGRAVARTLAAAGRARHETQGGQGLRAGERRRLPALGALLLG